MTDLDPNVAAQRLTTLLDLDTVGLAVRGAFVANGGASNSPAGLYLSNGSVARFRRLHTVGNPRSVATELACTAGTAPKLTRDEATEAIVLLRAVAFGTDPQSRSVQ